MKKLKSVRKVLVGGLFLLGTVSLLNSCGGCNGEGSQSSTTPKEAMVNYASNESCQMAMSIRVGDLITKSGLEGDLLPADMKMMADSFLGQYLDSEQTGIDINGTCYLFGDFTGLPKKPSFMAITVPVTNAETFASFLEGQTRLSPESGDGYSFVKIQKSGVIVWNSGFAAFVAGDKVDNDLEGVMKALVSKGKNKVNQLEKFADRKCDLGFFMDYEHFVKVMPQDDKYGDMMSSKMMADMMKDSYISGTVNFENGKIEAIYAMDVNSKMKDFINKMYRNGNSEFAKYLGGENLIGFGTVALNLPSLLGFYEETGFLESPEIADKLKEFKEKSGISLLDMVNKFTGEVSIGFVGLKEEANDDADAPSDEYMGYSESRKNTTPIITLAIGVNDQELNKIFDTIPGLKNVNGVYHFPSLGGMCYKNSILFATTDEALLADFAEDGMLTPYNKNNAQTLISSNSVAGYMNFQALAEAMGEINPEVAEAVSKLDYAEFTVSKDSEMKAVLYMKDKNANSLKSLGKMIIESSMSGGRMF